jgi:hypothetical protein
MNPLGVMRNHGTRGMTGSNATFAIQKTTGSHARAQAPAREMQELWFTLARRPWSLLVLVPAGDGASAASVATRLAEVGRHLREMPVTFLIMAETIDYPTAGRIVSTLGSAARQNDSAEGGPASKVVVAIPSVVSEPLGLVVAKAADLVVLCIEKGKTAVPAAQRTIDLIGRDRIAGCLYIE